MELETPVVCLTKAEMYKCVFTVRAIRALSDAETRLRLFAGTPTPLHRVLRRKINSGAQEQRLIRDSDVPRR